MLNVSVYLQIALAAETHIAEGLTLKLCITVSIEHSLIILVAIRKQQNKIWNN